MLVHFSSRTILKNKGRKGGRGGGRSGGRLGLAKKTLSQKGKAEEPTGVSMKVETGSRKRKQLHTHWSEGKC